MNFWKSDQFFISDFLKKFSKSKRVSFKFYKEVKKLTFSKIEKVFDINFFKNLNLSFYRKFCVLSIFVWVMSFWLLVDLLQSKQNWSLLNNLIKFRMFYVGFFSLSEWNVEPSLKNNVCNKIGVVKLKRWRTNSKFFFQFLAKTKYNYFFKMNIKFRNFEHLWRHKVVFLLKFLLFVAFCKLFVVFWTVVFCFFLALLEFKNSCFLNKNNQNPFEWLVLDEFMFLKDKKLYVLLSSGQTNWALFQNRSTDENPFVLSFTCLTIEEPGNLESMLTFCKKKV